MEGNSFDLRLAVQQVVCEHKFMGQMFRDASPTDVKHYFKLRCIKCSKTLLKEVPQIMFHKALAVSTADSPAFSWTKAHDMAIQMIQERKEVCYQGGLLSTTKH